MTHYVIRFALIMLFPGFSLASTIPGISIKNSFYSLSKDSPYNKLTCSVKNPKKLIDLHINSLKKNIPGTIKNRLYNTVYTFSLSRKKACSLSTSDKFADPAIQKGIHLMENLINTTVCVYFDYLYLNSWANKKSTFTATKNPQWYYGVGTIRNRPFNAWVHQNFQQMQFQTKNFPVSNVKFKKMGNSKKYILTHASNKKPNTNLMATISNIKYKFLNSAYIPVSLETSVGTAYGNKATLELNCVVGKE